MQPKHSLFKQIFTNILCYTLILSFISCGQVPNPKENNSSNKPVTSRFTKVDFARSAFVSTYILPMQSEFDESLDVMQDYLLFKSLYRNTDSEAYVDIKKLDRGFHQKYSDRLLKFQKETQTIKDEFEENKAKFEEIKKHLTISGPQIEKLKLSSQSCSNSLKTQKRQIESGLNSKKKQIDQTEKDLIHDIKKAKKYKRSAKKYKKKVARSNYPPDKSKYAKKAEKHAKKSESYGKKAKKKHARLKQQIRQANNISKTGKKSLSTKANWCKNTISNLNTSIDLYKNKASDLSRLQQYLGELSLRNKELNSQNMDMLDAYQKYSVTREKMAGTLQARIDELHQQYLEKTKKLVQTYSSAYVEVYKAAIGWINSKEVSGRSSMKLMNLLNDNASKYPHLAKMNREVIKIVNMASKKMGTNHKKTPSRSIAAFMGIELPDLNLNLPALPDIKVDMPHFTVDLPDLNFNLPTINLNLPKLPKLDLSFNLPNFELAEIATEVVSPVGELANLKLPEIKIPELKLVHISAGINQDINQVISRLRNIKIEVPKIEVVRISADIQEDLKNPARVFQNSYKTLGEDAVKTVVKTGTNVIRETGVAANNLKRTADIAIHDTVKTVGDGVKGIRNFVAQMQGINVEKTLKKIRALITQCRHDKSQLSQATASLAKIKSYLVRQKSKNPDISLERKNKIIQGKLDKLSSVQQTAAAASIIASKMGTFFNFYGATNAATQWATSAGVYTAIAAAVVIAMMSNVEAEIKHEQEKLEACGKNFAKVFKKFETTHIRFIAEVESNTEKLDELKRIDNEFGTLFDLFIAADLDEERPKEANYYNRIETLKNDIKRYQSEYQIESSELNRMLNELEQMS